MVFKLTPSETTIVLPLLRCYRAAVVAGLVVRLRGPEAERRLLRELVLGLRRRAIASKLEQRRPSETPFAVLLFALF